MPVLLTCPICSSAAIKPFFVWTDRGDGRDWGVDRCAQCTVAFTNPQPSWDELKPYYGGDYWPYQPASAAELAGLIQESVRTGEYDRIRLTPNDRVLEIGPGGGRFLLVAQHICTSALGVEPSEDATRILRGQGCDIFNGHIDDFAKTYEGDKFSLVAMSHVLEHLHRPLDALMSIRKVMARDAKLVMRMPNAGSWAFRAVKGDWMGTDLPRHLIHWNATALAALAKLAGMEIVKTTYDSPPGIVGQALTARARFGYKIPDKIVWIAPKLVDKVARSLSERWVTPNTAMNVEVHFREIARQ